MTTGSPLGEDTGRQPDMTFQYPGKHLNLENVRYGTVSVSTVQYIRTSKYSVSIQYRVFVILTLERT